MIRRNPTLIPMTDSDVQDVRDMVAAQKEEDQKREDELAKLAKSTTLTSEDLEAQLHGLKNEKMRRLGLSQPTSESPSKSTRGFR